MSKSASKPFTGKELCVAGIEVIKSVVRQIIFDSESDPETAFEQVRLGKRAKPALRVDLGAEDSFARGIHKYKNHRYECIHVLGEERLADEHIDLTSRSGDLVLVDALDGTDLLERGLGNWCSAAVFYRPTNPVGKRIIAVVVGVANGDVYFSSIDNPTVSVSQKDGSARSVYGPVSAQTLESATICFYGQKIGGLKSLSQTRLIHDGKILDSSNMRFHTLAGIPMMLKLIDRRVRDARGIDVVFDVRGQKPHDVVPGAYLCLKAGAHLLDVNDGEPLTLAKLENCLMFPASKEHKLKYVIGADATITAEIYDLLKPYEGPQAGVA